ncbi:hypothetical protein ElyMa_005297300 [Elysia marginata]|uniref:Uncharacterized protein n=1 Tax=Elysia marginata TaxID=1093978 RepID=A0AAV4K0D1_9GAST|nr:hypothetical protein ElyMa_005297300 [Elysia marginata]
MVVVTGLTAMHHHNPRPRQAGAIAANAITISSYDGGGGERQPLHARRRPPVAGISTLIDVGPGCSSSSGSDYEGSNTMELSNTSLSHSHNRNRQFYHHGTNDQVKLSKEPGFFYNGEQHSTEETDEASFQNNNFMVKTPKRTSVENFLSSPTSTPSPSSSPSSSPRKPASLFPKSSNSYNNANGLLTNSPGHVSHAETHPGHHKNGSIDTCRDYVLLSQNHSDMRQSSLRRQKFDNELVPDGKLRVSNIDSSTRGGVNFLTQYADSCLIDAGEHNSRQTNLKLSESSPFHQNGPTQTPSTYVLSKSQDLSQQSSNGRKKAPKLSGAGPLFHNGKKGNSFGESEQNLSSPRLGNVRNSMPYASSDSPFASTSRLDVWGPSYVTASFFMSSSAAADPIHHPVPRRGIHDVVRRSQSSGMFANVSPPQTGTSEFHRSNSNTMSGTVGGSVDYSTTSQPAQHQHPRPRSSSNDMFRASKSKHLNFVQQQSPLVTAHRLHSSTRDLSSINRDAASLVAGKYDTGSLRSVKMIHIKKEEDTVSVKSMNATHSSNEVASTVGADDVYSGYSPVASNPSSYYSTLPRKGSHGQYLRRTLSHDPKAGEVTIKTSSIVVRTVSDGEIESEYVTLDRSYVPSSTSRLCRVIEDSPTTSSTSPIPSIKNHLSPPPPVSSSKEFWHVKNFSSSRHANNSLRNKSHGSESSESNGDASPTSINTVNLSANLVKNSKSPNSGMHAGQLKNNSAKKKHGPGPLRAMAETLGSVFSPHRSSEENESSSRQSSVETPVSPFDMSSPTSPISPLVMSTNYSTMQRSGSSRAKDNNQPQSGRMTRSKSLPDLQKDVSDVKEDSSDNAAKNYSDDEDGDEFGFLSYPISFSSSCASAVMNKAKSSPSPGARIFPKRWRSKSKAASTGAPDPAAMWTPGPPDFAACQIDLYCCPGTEITISNPSISQLCTQEEDDSMCVHTSPKLPDHALP